MERDRAHEARDATTTPPRPRTPVRASPPHRALALQGIVGNRLTASVLQRNGGDSDSEDEHEGKGESKRGVKGKDDRQNAADSAAATLAANTDLQRAVASGFNPAWRYVLYCQMRGIDYGAPKGHMTEGTGQGGAERHEVRHGNAARAVAMKIQKDADKPADTAVSAYFSGIRLPRPPSWWPGEEHRPAAAGPSSSSSTAHLREDKATQDRRVAEKEARKEEMGARKNALREYWEANLKHRDVNWLEYYTWCKNSNKGKPLTLAEWQARKGKGKAEKK